MAIYGTDSSISSDCSTSGNRPPTVHGGWNEGRMRAEEDRTGWLIGSGKGTDLAAVAFAFPDQSKPPSQTDPVAWVYTDLCHPPKIADLPQVSEQMSNCSILQ